jgi:hypothetical protein
MRNTQHDDKRSIYARSASDYESRRFLRGLHEGSNTIMNAQPQPKSIHDLFTFYLSADHIDQPRTVTVDVVTIKEVYSPQLNANVPSLVIHFKDARRSLKANKTHAAAMWEITGTDDYTKWTGARVTLSKEPTKRGGKFTVKISKPDLPTQAGPEITVPTDEGADTKRAPHIS